MHHSTTVFSPAGTAFADRTVGELVAESPGRSRVFQAHGIGFCCQGSRTLRQACELKGVAVDQIIRELEEAQDVSTAPSVNLAELSIAELRERLSNVHHAFLRSELERLHAMSERVAHVHGGHTPTLVELFNAYTDMASALVLHVERTERDLFPAFVESEAKLSPSIRTTLDDLVAEHEAIGEGMLLIRQLTQDFVPPPEACNTYRALFAGLKDLDADLQHHIHLENAVLFPKTRERSQAA